MESHRKYFCLDFFTQTGSRCCVCVYGSFLFHCWVVFHRCLFLWVGFTLSLVSGYLVWEGAWPMDVPRFTFTAASTENWFSFWSQVLKFLRRDLIDLLWARYSPLDQRAVAGRALTHEEHGKAVRIFQCVWLQPSAHVGPSFWPGHTLQIHTEYVKCILLGSIPNASNIKCKKINPKRKLSLSIHCREDISNSDTKSWSHKVKYLK